MTDYVNKVAEAVRDACSGIRGFLPKNKQGLVDNMINGLNLETIIASVPRPEPVATWAAGTAAIEFALEDATGEGMAFLRCWLYGDFDVIRKEWPEAPESVYIGADPLHPETVAMLAAAPEAPEPVLDRPASIGGTTFGVGIPVRTLVAAAQRRYEVEQTPASLADRQALIDALRRPVVDAELTTLREQNAALVAALEGVLRWIDHWAQTGPGMDFERVEAAADAALASAKGGAA